MIDVPGVGKTSTCLGDGELWQNTVWNIDDFISQEKFDFNVLKINKVNENRPRTLYIDLKHRTLTIHDPTGKGKKKENKVLDRTLIKSLEYSQTADNPQRDTITINYYQDKPGRNKKNFQAWFNDVFHGHRFVALMKTFIAPDKVSDHYKFGRGPFSVSRMFPNSMSDFELPERFPLSFMLNLLQQKYVELSLMERWCWSVIDSSSWMTDSSMTRISGFKSSRRHFLEELVKSFNLFLKWTGYELVNVLTATSPKSRRLLPRSSYSNLKKMKTVRTNWLDSKLDQLSVPKQLCCLIPALAEYLHDCWLRSKVIGKSSGGTWRYSEHHSFADKCSPWIVPWSKLSPSGKNMRTQQAVTLMKGAVAAGMFFKPRESRIVKKTTKK